MKDERSKDELLKRVLELEEENYKLKNNSKFIVSEFINALNDQKHYLRDTKMKLILPKFKVFDMLDNIIISARKNLFYEGVYDYRNICLISNQKSAVVYDPPAKGKISKDKKVKPISKLKVAMICDEFSYESFKYEFEIKLLSPGDFKQELIDFCPDIFFCESAWAGIGSNKPWKGKIYTSVNFEKENRIELLEIIKICKENKIPTIFWNKEDPTHYDDEVHNFRDTALLFDYIFTTDENCIKQYELLTNKSNVFALPFAVQPRLIHENTDRRNKNISFFGSWYEQHPQRCESMSEIFDEFIQNNIEIDIYDRHYFDNDPNHFFPEQYRKNIKGSENFLQVLELYSQYEVSLNINTVTDSRTMLARRVFELAASKTLIMSNSSKALKTYFGDNFILVPDDIKNFKEMSDIKKNQIIEKNYQAVMENHTYRHRVRKMLVDISYPYVREEICWFYELDSLSTIEAFLEEKINVTGTLILIIKEVNSQISFQKAIMKFRDQVLIVDFNYFTFDEKKIYVEYKISEQLSLDDVAIDDIRNGKIRSIDGRKIHFGNYA